MNNLRPGQEVPELILDTIKGMKWNIRQSKPENFTLLVFYRGIHCPACKKYLEELNKKIEDFNSRGVQTICISANSQLLAQQTTEEWEIENLNLGYGFSVEEARKWGLFISEAVKDSEPEVFVEPALFLVKPDNTLYAASIQSMPFARPKFDELLRAISFFIKDDYPAKGAV